MRLPFDFRGMHKKEDIEKRDWESWNKSFWDSLEDEENEEYDALEYAEEMEEYAEAYSEEEFIEAEDSEEAEYIEEEYTQDEVEEYTEESDNSVYAGGVYATGEYEAETYEEEHVEEYSDGYGEEYTEEYSEEYGDEYAEEYSEEYTEEYPEDYEGEEYIEEYPEDYVEEYTEEEYLQDAYYQQDYEEYKEVRRRAVDYDTNKKWFDYMLIGGAVAVLLLALLLCGNLVIKILNTEDKNTTQQLGSQLSNINLIGEQGLLAVSNAQKALSSAVEEVQATATPQPTDYDEEDIKNEVEVTLSLTSIEKDLKIKFLNKETGKLIGNVPFSVEATNEDGTDYFWSDDDMDGIIYKKNLAAGDYTIKVYALTEAKYNAYAVPTSEKKIEVKQKIEYEKVDVTAEIMDESEVDVQKEDTKKNDVIEEEYLQDTVQWVESTVVQAGYEKIDISTIPNPATLAFKRIMDQMRPMVVYAAQPSEGTVSGGDITPTAIPTETPTETPTEVPTAVPTETPTEVPTAVPTETPTEVPTVAPTETPTVAPTATASPTPTPTVSPSPTPSATPAPMKIELSTTKETVYIDSFIDISVKIENEWENVQVSATSSDTNVASVTVNGKTVRVNGLKAGTANISIVCSAADFTSSTLTCEVTVKMDPAKETGKYLKDSQGREVYVKDGESYRLATYADYYAASDFYIMTQAKYTGWQVIDGQYRYYDAYGKYVTGEQVIQGVKHTFSSDGSLVIGSGTMGIDVSKWNGNIDWTAVKNAGVNYVIIRCGYRGSSQGALIQDSKFEQNIKGANRAGIKVGVYFFSQAIDKNEAVEEASMVLECIKDYNISYPVFLDVEPSGGRADKLTKSERTEICKAFCETIKNYGYTAGIYANKTWLETKLDMSQLNGYKVWLAQYASEPTYQGRYDMWQYKDSGKVSGISGDVDLNMSYLGY